MPLLSLWFLLFTAAVGFAVLDTYAGGRFPIGAMLVAVALCLVAMGLAVLVIFTGRPRWAVPPPLRAKHRTAE